MGQAAMGCRHRRGDRKDAATIGLAASVGRCRNQRTAIARLVLPRIGRSRRRRVQPSQPSPLDTRPADPAVEGHRWAIEDSFETAKNEFGLDHNESRSWHGWHRHVSLVMLAFAMMAAIRHRANPPPPKKTKRRPPAKAKA